MRLSELSALQCWLPSHPTAADPIWQRDPYLVSEGEIQLFYGRSAVRGNKSQATEAIEALQAAVITAAFDGELAKPPAAIVMHEPPEDPFFVDELVDGLSKLRPARRQACLFALEAGVSPDHAASLTWKDALHLRQLPPLASEVLTAVNKTRHIKLPYCFWEMATKQIATPLLELQWSIEKAFDSTWPKIVSQHKRMINVNRSAEVASLNALLP